MSTSSVHVAPGYQFEAAPNLSRLDVRERLSHSAIEGFFSIADKWTVSIDQAGELLGGVPTSSVYSMKKTPRTLRQDELMRISYVVGIYKALHILLPEALADRWMTSPNDNPLFGGRTPLEFVIQAGIPGLQQVRSLVDAARGGR
ncbi:MAG TPA: MbcA/ParS/Xre antitoxin family protein [Edaphobacter sp.]|nr:MbcA/ParS/Xre antitoxin family protein [Edaphobacter sp.]